MSTIKELYAYRQMIFSLVKKDLRGRYKGSVLGFMWTFINPLLQLIVYSLVFGHFLTAVGNTVERYSLHLFVALIPWIFFSSSVTTGAASIVAQKELIKKIYFPRMVIPIAYVTSCFVNMLLSFIVVFAVIIVTGAGINFLAVLTLPVIMIVEYVFALGMSLLASAITVYFRDLEHILSIVTMAWMYLTPVVYAKSIVPKKYLPLFNLNPMTHIIDCYRTVLYHKQIPDLSSLLLAAGLGIFFLIFGTMVFNKLQRHFAEEL
jgi:ABC-2 type transport system permease protein